MRTTLRAIQNLQRAFRQKCSAASLLFRVAVLSLKLSGAAALLLTLGASPAQAAGLLIADGPFGGRLAITEHQVNVTLNNGIAVTEVEQVFLNQEQRTVEALYTFPVPEGASVADFSMWINGEEMVGEVVEKERAREIYNSYKRQPRPKDPGLLEQTDFRSFEMRIFPIAAGAEQRVRITYYQELPVDGDWVTYVYPLATATRPGADSRVEGRFAFDLHIRSVIPITAVESPSHGADVVTAAHTESYHQVSLERGDGDLARDIVVAAKLERERTGFDLIATRTDGEDGYFLLTLTPGRELAELDRGMDYVFVLDTSGSMDREGKLSLSRSSVEAFVDSLGEKDRFEIITFNVTANPLFGNLTSPGDDPRRRARDFLGSQQARGGTFLMPALTTAYRYQDPDRTLNVVVLSDGMTQQAELRELSRAIQNRPAGSRLFAIGIGNDVNRPLLEEAAERSGGLAAFISRGDDFERQARAFRRKLLRPAAANPEITFSGGDVYDLEPVDLPDLFHGSPLRLYGRYRDAGPVEVTFRADVGGERIEQTVPIELPRDEAANPELERMWAWKRVDRLLKEADREGDRSRVIDEIVRLGEGYSIVTEYTSFLVLENDDEYRRWRIERRNALRYSRDRAAQRRVEDELARLRGKAQAGLGPEAAEQAAQKLAAKNPAGPERSTSRPTPSRNASPSSSSRDTRRDVSLGGGAVDLRLLALVAALIAAVLAVRKQQERRLGREPGSRG